MTAYRLTELQLAIMQVLWTRGEATVSEVQHGLDRGLAQSTVATLLSRLERKGLVVHRAEGRQYVYRAAVPEADVRQSVVKEFTALAGDLFDGDVAALVSHLITARDVDRTDLARIRAMIAARERELRGRKR